MRSRGIAMPLISRYLTISAIFFFLVSFLPAAQTANPPFSSSSSFAFQGFDKNHTNIALYGDAVIRNSDVQIMRKGRVMYNKPIRFLGTNPGFSAYFSFSLSPGEGDLAFSLLPSTSSATAPMDDHPCCILSVKYVANRIQLHLGGEISITNPHLSTTNPVLDSGEKLHSWIDYNGETNNLQVRLNKLRDPRPANSSISYPIDLSPVLWRESLLVGIISSLTSGTSTSSVYSWSFVVRHGAPYLMHSEPLDPRDFMVKSQEIPPITATKPCPLRIIIVFFFGAACVLLVALAGMFVLSPMLEKRPLVPVEYPEHPTECGDEKIVLVGEKDTE